MCLWGFGYFRKWFKGKGERDAGLEYFIYCCFGVIIWGFKNWFVVKGSFGLGFESVIGFRLEWVF